MNKTTTKKQKIFYSWQSDNAKTRNYIKTHLENVIKKLSNSPELIYRPVLDHDTKGELGSPDITAIIKKKIDSCDLFIADISFIEESSNCKFVNQNVLYELGYATGKHSDAKVIMLFNLDTGKIAELPFDISHKRVTGFSIKDDDKSKNLESILIGILPSHLRNSRKNKTPSLHEELNLDIEDLQILKFFSTMDDEKHIIIVRTLDGESIISLSSKYDEKLLKEINSGKNHQRVIASLDDLADKKILRRYISPSGTINYKVAKLGYNILDSLSEETPNNTQQ